MQRDSNIPRLNPSVEITPIDVASKSKKFIVKVSGGKQFEISETLLKIINLIDGKRTVEDIARKVQQETTRKYSAFTIDQIVDTFLVPNAIVLTENVSLPRKQEKSFLYINVPLFSQQFLRPITSILEVFFVKPIFYTLITILLLFTLYFYSVADKVTVSLVSITGMEALLVYGILFLTTLFHELGHSSACQHYGAKHGSIGIGLYLYFLVFYADVSDVWKLKRDQRAMVDIGGIYFQLLCVPILYFLYLITKSPIFLYAIYATYWTVIMALNPFLRFDGYWLVSDIAGVPNLRKRSYEAVKFLYERLTK